MAIYRVLGASVLTKEEFSSVKAPEVAERAALVEAEHRWFHADRDQQDR